MAADYQIYSVNLESEQKKSSLEVFSQREGIIDPTSEMLGQACMKFNTVLRTESFNDFWNYERILSRNTSNIHIYRLIIQQWKITGFIIV